MQIGLVTASHYVGEREVAWRIQVAGERLGWNVVLDEEAGFRIKDQKLDWVICMLPKNAYFNPHCPNYLTVFHPFHYLNEQRRFKSFYEKYDGYLLTIPDRETLEKGLQEKKKEFHHVRFYPTVYAIPYQKVALNDLVVMIPVWGNRREDPKFVTLYTLLNQSGFTKFYGARPLAELDSQNYMGSIPFDGISVIKVLQQHGIALVIHSEIHNIEAIPSPRIFEAAAASTVIISDENPFVKKHFGDSVFYIDINTTGENIFNQIQAHIQTILKNPKRALRKAKKAHRIFIDNFTMEQQLLQLQAMHQKIISKMHKEQFLNLGN